MIPRNYSKAISSTISFDKVLVSGGYVSAYLIMWNVKHSVNSHSFLTAPDNILHCNVRGKCHSAAGRIPEGTSIRPVILPHLNDSLDLTINFYCEEFVHHKESTQHNSLKVT